MALAVFGTLPEGNKGKLAERMARWNTEHPSWAYRRTSNFARDVKRALERLLGDLKLYPELEGGKQALLTPWAWVPPGSRTPRTSRKVRSEG